MRNCFKLGLVLIAFTPGLASAIGAIAIDDERGDYEAGYGISIGAETKEEAFETAMEFCAEAGNEACRKVSWFETCGSYAASTHYYGAGWGVTAADAQTMAMEKCGDDDCRVIVTECEN